MFEHVSYDTAVGRVASSSGSAFRDGVRPESGIYGLDASRSPSGYAVFAGMEMGSLAGGGKGVRTFGLELGSDGLCDAKPRPAPGEVSSTLPPLDWPLADKLHQSKPGDLLTVILQPRKLPATNPFVEQVRRQAAGRGYFDRAGMVKIAEATVAHQVAAIQREVIADVVQRGGKVLARNALTGAMLVELAAEQVAIIAGGPLVAFATPATAELVAHADNEEQRRSFGINAFWDAGFDGALSYLRCTPFPTPRCRPATRPVHVGIVDLEMEQLEGAALLRSGPPEDPGLFRLLSSWDCSFLECRPGFPTLPPLPRERYHGAEMAALIAGDFTSGQRPDVPPESWSRLSGMARRAVLHAADVSASTRDDNPVLVWDWANAAQRVAWDGARAVNMSLGFRPTVADATFRPCAPGSRACTRCECCDGSRCVGVSPGAPDCPLPGGVLSCFRAYPGEPCDYSIGTVFWLNYIAQRMGVNFVVAAGNDGHDGRCTLGVPANAGWAHAVGANAESFDMSIWDNSSQGGSAIRGDDCPDCRTIVDTRAFPVQDDWYFYWFTDPPAGTSASAARTTGAMAVFLSWLDQHVVSLRSELAVLEGPDPIALFVPEDPGFTQLMFILAPFPDATPDPSFSLWGGAGMPNLPESWVDGEFAVPTRVVLGKVEVRAGSEVVIPIDEYAPLVGGSRIRAVAMWPEEDLTNRGRYFALIDGEFRLGTCPPDGAGRVTPRITRRPAHYDDKYRWQETPRFGECAEIVLSGTRIPSGGSPPARTVYVGWHEQLPL